MQSFFGSTAVQDASPTETSPFKPAVDAFTLEASGTSGMGGTNPTPTMPGPPPLAIVDSATS